MSHNHQKKIAVINDFCGFGRCSIAVSLPIISAMKIQCCPLPTSIFSNHTGYDSFYFTDYTESMKKYADEWKKLNLTFNGILTGYLASEQQIEIVINFISEFKTDDTCVIVDPVMGDYGKLYPTYSHSLALKMKDIVPYADILTPNLTEACILTDKNYNKNISDSELFKICSELSESGPKKIVISGLEQGNSLVNYVFEQGKMPEKIFISKIGTSRSGTGDVFSSVISGDAVNNVPFADSVRHASSFIAKVLNKTVEMNIPETDGICFEEFLTDI